MIAWLMAVALGLGALPAHAEEPTLKRLLMLEFELIDDQQEYVPFPEKDARLAMISSQLRDAFVQHRLYAVVDDAPVEALVRAAKSKHDLRNCNGCERDIARAAGADRVLVAWVQKVSNLILNINIEIRDVATGSTVLVKSIDLRGNTDTSWRRGIDYLVQGIVDKGQGNR